jgi:UDP-GlcNAc:undecaprenyl-phosphate GlcNAc-1-phosphate transferase
VVALFFPLVILAVPILDTGFVVAKRLKYRRPVYRADTEHFHHRMARIGFSPRRTIAYLYAWTMVLAAVALALRFVPYSDDHGNFDPVWTTFMAACLIGAVAASIYVVNVLEILKLRSFRLRQLVGLRAPGEPLPAEAEIDAGIEHELETGTFAAVDPDTGEIKAIDPDTGEFQAVPPGGKGVSRDSEPAPPARVPDTGGSSRSPGEPPGPERPRRS